MTRLLVVADDPTGAADTGHEFAARGLDVAVVGPNAPDGDADVLVVDTDSRERAPGRAATRVRAAVDRPAAGVYKKLDSTLRGNVVAELDALVAACGLDAVVVAPAFPATGRVTAGGYHLVDGVPVDESAAGEGEHGPETAHLPTLLSAAESAVAHLALEAVAAGPVALADRLAAAVAGRDGPVLVAADATAPAHLDAVAGAAAAVAGEFSVGIAGSAGLAQHVRIGSERARVLGVTGSTHPRTLEGLSVLPDDRVVALDPERTASEPAVAVEQAVGAADAALDGEEYVAVTAARERADVDRALAAGREAGLDATATRQRVAETLGRVAAGVHGRGALTGLFLTGGAVAGATLEALSATGLRPAGRAIAAGVPVSTVAGGAAAGTPAVTRAGGFGDDSTIVNCLRALARSHE
jgi:uncharacterized protein YgbK (DUF1537 family)